VDSSQFGLRIVLEQQGHPMIYISGYLSKSERGLSHSLSSYDFTILSRSATENASEDNLVYFCHTLKENVFVHSVICTHL
jgi:hypothetical protein